MILDRMRIGTRLNVGFGMVLVLLAAVATLSVVQMRSLTKTNGLSDAAAERSNATERWTAAVKLNLNRALSLGKSGYQEALAAYLEPQMKATSEDITKLQGQIEKQIESPDRKSTRLNSSHSSVSRMPSSA